MGAHLVADGLGAAPLEEDLFDAAGAGHPEALRPLQRGFGVQRCGAPAHMTRKERERQTLKCSRGEPCPLCNRGNAASHLPGTGLAVQPGEDGSAGLSANAARQSLRPHQLPPPLCRTAAGPVAAHVDVSAGGVGSTESCLTSMQRDTKRVGGGGGHLSTHLSCCESPE